MESWFVTFYSCIYLWQCRALNVYKRFLTCHSQENTNNRLEVTWFWHVDN